MSFWVSHSTPTRFAFACTALNLASGSGLTGAAAGPAFAVAVRVARGAALGLLQAEACWGVDRRDRRNDQAPVAAAHSSAPDKSLGVRNSSAAGRSRAVRRPPDRRNRAVHSPPVRNSQVEAGRNRSPGGPIMLPRMAPIPNPTSPAPTADLGPACAGRVSDSAAVAIAAAVTAVLKTLSIGDPSCRPPNETSRRSPPYANV